VDTASSSEPTPEQPLLHETQDATGDVAMETVADDALSIFNKRMLARNSAPLVKLLDEGLPRTLEEIHKNFRKALEDGKFYPHSRITCSNVEPVIPDYGPYFQIHNVSFDSYEGYVSYFWDDCYSDFDALVSQDFTKDFYDHGYFFKHDFDPFKELRENFYDYFVVLTEKEYELFHVTGVLTPTLEYRHSVLNLHCGAGALKHAFYMYLANSHAGRNANVHYVNHFRLNERLICQLLASGLFTIWNRHYTDYSLVIKKDINFNLTGGDYQFATIKFHRDFLDYMDVLDSRAYANDGSLYFDFKHDVPGVILDVFCTDVQYASFRLELFKRCTPSNRQYLVERGYYSEHGRFLLQLEDHRYTAEPLTTDATTTTAAVIHHNTNCTINMHPAFHLGGSTPPWATGAATTQWFGTTGPDGDEDTGAEQLKDSEADFSQEGQEQTEAPPADAGPALATGTFTATSLFSEALSSEGNPWENWTSSSTRPTPAPGAAEPSLQLPPLTEADAPRIVYLGENGKGAAG